MEELKGPLKSGEELRIFVNTRPALLTIARLIDEGGFSYVYECKCHYLDSSSSGNNQLVIKVYKGGAGRSSTLVSNEISIIKSLLNNRRSSKNAPEILNTFSIFREGESGRLTSYTAILFPFYRFNLSDVITGGFKFIAAPPSLLASEIVGSGVISPSMQSKKYSYLPIKIKKRVIRNLIDAVDSLHKAGVAHLDLKLENVFLEYENPAAVYDGIPFPTAVKIIDFNSSIFAPKSPSDEICRFCGTTAYLSPETLLDETVNKSTDLWALGIMIYEIVTEGYLFESYRNLSEDKGLVSTSGRSSKTFNFKSSNCAEYPETYSLLRDFYSLLGPPPTHLYDVFIGYYYNSRGEPLLHPGEGTPINKDLAARIKGECSALKDDEYSNRDEFYETAADIILSFVQYEKTDRRAPKNVLKIFSSFFEE